MEPRIQYAKTSDGVSIAYSVMGEGAPLVHLPWWPLCHLQAEWQVAEIRRWYELLAEKARLVRYDMRGTGLSERDVDEVSLETMLLDLEAVVDSLNIQEFCLFAGLSAGPPAIAYAAVRHSGRMSRWSSSMRTPPHSGILRKI